MNGQNIIHMVVLIGDGNIIITAPLLEDLVKYIPYFQTSFLRKI